MQNCVKYTTNLMARSGILYDLVEIKQLKIIILKVLKIDSNRLL